MTAIKYERETCGRCGGSGRFSYNQIDGDRCYGCSGTGEKLTKRGSVAREYATSILEKRVEDIVLQEGQLAIYRDAMTGERFKVARIEEGAPMGRRGNGALLRSFDLFTPSGKHVGAISDSIKLRLTPTEEQVEEVMNYQESLTKAGKPRKRA